MIVFSKVYVPIWDINENNAILKSWYEELKLTLNQLSKIKQYQVYMLLDIIIILEHKDFLPSTVKLVATVKPGSKLIISDELLFGVLDNIEEMSEEYNLNRDKVRNSLMKITWE